MESTVHIKEFLSGTEVDEILAILQSNYNCSSNNYVPYRFSEFNWQQTDEHFSTTTTFDRQFFAGSLSNIRERLNAAIPSFKIRSIREMECDFLFNQMTIRVLHPGMVDIHEHCENISAYYFERFFAELNKVVTSKDQYSILIMLQPPSEGGQIVVYDEHWKDLESVPEQISRLQQLDASGNDNHVSMRFNLGKGDMLFFPAGRTFHKVSQAHGDRPRITLGGFAAYHQQEPETLVFWS
ncbi:MAG: hypothetical protein H6603_04325 [Flavobacteriales bacterium]|nr:hypothetical protein [Flavobacteriales bacterium]MCB9204186.1 hypothetical protein [Flavobacteriales bacterium]